ncbi:MAG: hypothetical protein DSY90_00170 [Deltaproteobacteria bacterium]|nr:MAG: hypothetical protein DSY90_00170 [Deltaproteobacteria bacterium]
MSGRDHPAFFASTRYCNILLYHSVSRIRGKSQGGKQEPGTVIVVMEAFHVKNDDGKAVR